MQAVIDEKAYNDSKINSNSTSNTKTGITLGDFVFPLQYKENLSSTKSKRLAIGAAVIIVYIIHYLFVALVNFLPKGYFYIFNINKILFF